VSTLAVEVNDAGILVGSDPPGSPAQPSPGYALVDGASLLTGAQAAASARLRPRRVNNRFWCELDTAPLRRPFPSEISHADLAHAHLAGIWDGVGGGAESVILVLPGCHTDHQLGLILGIARACGMPVSGMVDAAVAAAAGGHPGSRLLHVDLHLHRAVLTELRQERKLSRRRVEVSTHTGLASLHDAWAKRIAATFVQRTRFDPLHAATTEQELYRELPALLRRLRSSESALLEIDGGGVKTRAVELTARDLAAATQEAYSGIVQLVRLSKRAGEHATVLLSHRAAGLPDLPEQMAEVADAEVVLLPPDAAVTGALDRRASIQSSGESVALPFITRLPVRHDVQRSPSTAPSPSRARAPAVKGCPTHLLHAGQAHSIDTRPFVLGVAIPAGRRGLNLSGQTAGISRTHCSVYRRGERVWVEDHSTHGSFLNGQRVDGTAELVVGDRLRLGSPGIELRMIRVVESDGAPQD
jgi:hypothetical protein